MTRTYQEVVTRARRILQDEDATSYRYSAASLLDSVNDAMAEVRRLRPDLFLNTGFEVPVATDLAQQILLEDFWFMSLVYFTVGFQMLRDDEYSIDSRAVNLLNKATSQLQTTKA